MSPSKKVSAAKRQTGAGPRARSGKRKAQSLQRSKGAARRAASVEAAVVETSPAQAEPQKPASRLNTNLLRILAVLAVIGITVYIYSIRDRVEEFAVYGYPGIFLIALMANAIVILPAPGVAVVFAMGSVFNPFGVAFAAGAGGAIGELTGYLTGFSGQAVVENTALYNRLLPWVRKYGAWVILVLSAIPNPFFDTAGIAAGIAKVPLWQFLLACWVGQTIKMAMFAFAGAYSIDWIAGFYE